MKRLFFIFSLVVHGCILFAQKKEAIQSPGSFFPKERIKVLVVGTFHLDYPGLDAHKTDDQDKIDVLKDPKKAEVTALVEYLKKFKPTKIAIEAFPGWNATNKLREYNQGGLRDKRDERIQIAVRLASELKLDTLYSIDAESFDNELSKLDTNYFTKLFADYDFDNSDPYNAMYKKWLIYEDKLPSKMTLLDYFKRINSKESHRLGYGAYLIGDYKLDDTRGADILSVWWYNRNLRIFRNLQRLSKDPTERILMVFGNGHAAVLRQLLESSPEYEFIEFDQLK
ncbi:DUF5694 domain-containing protein [Pollutibacter soli]|uniref:DUF5694 domain-containing protein n=1 Tax=Pollutibacter soli TaxID=3034157 RepID=UPI0030141248